MSEMARVNGFPAAAGLGGGARRNDLGLSCHSEWQQPVEPLARLDTFSPKPGISSSSHNDTAPIESGQFTGVEGLAGSQADLQHIHALWI